MIYRNRKVEQCAYRFLKTLPRRIAQFPVNVKDAILTLNNCRIHSYQQFAQHHHVSVADVTDYCESAEGCTVKDAGNYIIIYNDDESVIEERKIFTLAHELGHILLGHCDLIEKYHINRDDVRNKVFGREANYFAACLLCPMPVLSFIEPETVRSVRIIFRLSNEAAQISFNDLENYDKNYNIQWHNDMLHLFDFELELLKIFTCRIDYIDRLMQVKYAAEVREPKADDFPPGIFISVPKHMPTPCFADKIYPRKAEVTFTKMFTESPDFDFL